MLCGAVEGCLFEGLLPPLARPAALSRGGLGLSGRSGEGLQAHMPCTTMHHPAAALLRAATCAGAPPHTRHAPRRGARAEPPGTPWRNSEHAAPLEHPARLPRLGRPVHLGGTAHLASALPPNSPHAVASAERAEARTPRVSGERAGASEAACGVQVA
ncbi:unnamed protein product [Prorocentrum cordatum]|uniref:Uncharacterized protein n=2 Tax=Prorocentrum cordatum TaxID=2364126 RepID=A0ABN9WDN3_9DINO|nr:unnamed protein product [Polarella glacialis]